MSIRTVVTRGYGAGASVGALVLRGYFAEAAAATTRTTVHPRSGIRGLTPAMLKKMQRRAELQALRDDDEQAAAWLLLGIRKVN